MTRRGEATRAVAITCLVAVALAVRLPGLLEPLWYDELWSTRVMLGSLGELAWQAVFDLHPPLYHAFSFGWLQLFGDSELASRLPPLLAGLATVALMPRLGTSFGMPAAGWIGGGLLALSPVHIWYSQEARSYSALMLCAVLLALAFQRMGEEGVSRRQHPLFVVLAAVATLIEFQSLFVVGLLFLVSLGQPRKRRTAATAMMVSGMLVGTVIAVRLSLHALRTRESYLTELSWQQLRELFVDWFLLGGSPLAAFKGGAGGVALVITAGFVVTAFALIAHWLVRKARDGDADYRVTLVGLMMCIPAVLLAMGLLGAQQYYINRTALPALPFFYLAIGAGVERFRRPSTRRVAVAVLATGSATVLAVFWSGSDRWTVSKPNPDWPRAVHALEASVGSGNPRAVIVGTAPLREMVYYGAKAAECPWPPNEVDLRRPALLNSLAHRLRRERPSCGPDGTALLRLYLLKSGSLEDLRNMLAYEQASGAFLMVEEFWLGAYPVLSAELSAASNVRVEPITAVRGLRLSRIALENAPSSGTSPTSNPAGVQRGG